MESVVTKTNYKYHSWTPLQLLAQQTQSGCVARPGDILGTGTLSGPAKESRACLVELNWNNTEDVHLRNGKTRRFLEDGDKVTLRGYAEKNGIRVGFGECTGVIMPANLENL